MDIVVPGDFSTPRQIRAALANLRRKSHATAAILAIFELPNQWLLTAAPSHNDTHNSKSSKRTYLRARKLFKSLLIASHEHQNDERKLQGSLHASAPTVSKNLKIPSRAHKWSKESIKKIMAQEPFSRARTQLEHLHIYGLSPSSQTDAVHPLKILILLGVQRGSTVAPEGLESELVRLNELVAASEAVAVNRSMTLGHTIDHVLDVCEQHINSIYVEADPDAGMAPELRELAELARLSLRVTAAGLLLTNSKVGNLFLSAKNPASLYNAASCIMLPAKAQGWHRKDGVMLDRIVWTSTRTLLEHDPETSEISQEFIRHVHRTNHPLVVNGVQDFQDTHDAVHYTREIQNIPNSRVADLRELAVPVNLPGAVTQGDPGIFGVLSFEKRRGRYGGNDLFIARHLAQYFCLKRAQVLSDRAGVIMGSVARSKELTELDTADTVRAYCRLTAAPLLSSSLSNVPLEFCPMAGAIDSAVEALYLSTRSAHITVRLASPDGKMLYRFAEYPKGAGDPALKQISTNHPGSVNSWVFRNGRSCNLKNVDSRKEQMKHAGLAGVQKTYASPNRRSGKVTSPREHLGSHDYCKSEYCVPISVRGRTIGTVDLESCFLDAYAGQTHVIEMMVRQIELLLLRAQQAFENQLFMTLATTRLSSHEILGVADQLVEASGSPELIDLPTRCEVLSNRLREIVSQVSAISYSPHNTGAQTLKEVLDMASGEGQVFSEVNYQDPEGLLAYSLEAALAYRLTLIIKPLLSNAVSATNLTPHGDIRITPRRVTRSGKQFLLIIIGNPLRHLQFPNAEKARALFRVPIATDRWHLGTFMAGVLARALGGDIFAVFNEGRKHVQVLIQVPFPEAAVSS
jgi:hypothetical protein